MGADPTPAESTTADRAPFEVLFVCTANICRSPMAEQWFRWQLNARLGKGARHDWVVRSAGTRAIEGLPIHPLAAAVLEERGVPVADSTSRRLDEATVAQAGLILTAGRSQRAAVVQMVPAAVQRVFTLRQFARLCRAARLAGSSAPFGRGDDLLLLARSGRRHLQPVDAARESIADPMGRDIEAFRQCSDLIDRCLLDILG
jgi:protein-tyrosine phosphatase